jgi:hypothetical protein
MVTYDVKDSSFNYKISSLITKFRNCSCSYVRVVTELNDDRTSLINIDWQQQ